MLVVAIDIGGTFTDLMGFDDKTGQFVDAKSLTTPQHLVQGIIDCIRKCGIKPEGIDELLHGSTTAINTLIERKGAKTGLIVTKGTRDVYLIGRGNRPESYNLFFHRHEPLIARRLMREADERVLASGEVLEPLKKSSVEDACKTLAAEGVDAVAVCFLHSYVNPEHEREAGDIVRKMGEAHLLTLASPTYLAQQGHPAHPRDLAHHACLVYSQDFQSTTWVYHRAGGVTQVDVRPRLAANNGDALLQAAAQGLGITRQPDFMARPYLDDGRLVPVLADFAAQTLGIYAVLPSNRYVPHRVSVLIDFIARTLRAQSVSSAPTSGPSLKVRPPPQKKSVRALHDPRSAGDAAQ